MRIIYLFMLLFMATPSIYSQNSISGHITDADVNAQLSFVNIYLPQLEKGTISDENGSFTIENLPNGNYKIIVSYLGYETFSKIISLPTEVTLDIQLKPSAIEMEAVILSTPFHKLQSENVMKVERASVSDLKAQGAINLADGVSNIPGVESVTTGVSIGKPVIRGLSSNRVLVYTQGVRLENQQFGDEHGLGINEAGIESVEVIKGPASLLYGSDALGGVLYINPERFAAANTNATNLSGNYFSNTQGFNTSAGYKSSGEHIKFLFRGSLAEHSDYKTADYRVTNTRYKEQDFKAGIGFQREKLKTELRYNVNHSKLGIPEEVAEQSSNKTPLFPFQDITNHVFSSKSTVFFDNSSLDINLGFLYNDRKEFEEPENDAEAINTMTAIDPALHLKLKTFNYDLKYNLPTLGKFETIVGVQGMNQVNGNYGEEQLIPDAITNDIGVLATSHIHFETIDVQLGARFDNRAIDVDSGISRNFNSFNGAFGIKANLIKRLTLRLNLATGFRAPNLAELTSNGTHEGTNRYEIGNSNLDTEQNFQTDLALEYKNEHLELFANVFFNKINNYIFIAPNGDFKEGNPVFNYIQHDAKLYGGEFGIHLHPHPLDWLHIESSFETVTGQQDNNSYLPLIPANTLKNTLRMEFDKKGFENSYVFIKYSSTFDQNKTNEFETSTKGYNLLSAGLGSTVQLFKRDLEISIVANNLTNKTYINHLSRLKPESIFNIGRNFSFGLNYSL